jgi:hypothetical protein
MQSELMNKFHFSPLLVPPIEGLPALVFNLGTGKGTKIEDKFKR